MSKADDLFIAMCKDIIENGYDTKGERCVRNGRMGLRHIRSNGLVL